MRLTTFALFLSAGTVAICQSAARAPANPGQYWLTPPGMPQPDRDFTRLPPDWHINPIVPMRTTIVPPPGPLRPWDDAQIDAKIVVHPPPSSIGALPPGTLVAQDQYPGLQLLAIEQSQAKGQPIPTRWPNLKIENIPIAWPKFEIKPVDSGAKGPAAGK
jgi:hypothetical protein